MIHSFEEILTPHPANPNPPEAAMPQAAWEALLRDAVQGIRHPYTPKNLRRWLLTPHSRAWAISAPQASPPPHHQHSGEENGKGKARSKGARRGCR